MDEHKASDPTCKATGNNLYYVCKTCGDVFKADKTTATTVEEETLAVVDHKGGTASCSEQALCMWCQQPYGELLSHNFKEKIEDTAHFVAGSGADCQSAKKYYYDCTECSAIGTTTFSSASKGNHKMSTAWTTENGKHFHKCTVSGCTYTADSATCSGGTATCTAKAVCRTCGVGYGNLKSHTYNAVWTSNGTGNNNTHYLLCTACRTAKDKEAKHTFVWITDTAATEDTVGVKHEECSVCKVKRNEGTEIPKLPHVHVGVTYHDAVAATCVSTGNVKYWTCSSSKCAGKYYGDDACQLELQSIVEATNKDNHTGDTQLKGKVEATCGKDGYTGDTYCVSCQSQIKKGEVIVATGKHTPKTDHEKDDEQHWQICGDCSALIGNRKEEHILEWVVDEKPTESVEGKKHQNCTVCGYICNENTAIEKLPHEPVYVDGKAPTCTEDGVAGHFLCQNCGKYFVSKDGKPGEEITKDSVKLPATGHSFGSEWMHNEKDHWNECACGETGNKAAHTTELVNAKEATETETGYTGDKICSVCGYVVEQGKEIPVLESDAPVDTKVEIVDGGIVAVPETLLQAGLKTPEEVRDAIVEALKAQSNGFVKENVAHYDVTLQFTQDGGKTWIKADEQHFPENGKLKVVLPYPEGTDATYTFKVVHMFTSSAFGKNPGDVEFPTVTNTAEGIEFEVTGLSPISVGWTAPVNDVPPTGENAVPIVFVSILGVAIVIAATVIVLKKKRYI